MPWTIIQQELKNFHGTTMVDAKAVVIELEDKLVKNKKTGELEVPHVMVGASIFFRNDSWPAKVSTDHTNIQGCLKIFYSSQHGTFSVQWPHRIETDPHTRFSKLEEVKSRSLSRRNVLQKLAENNVPADFAAHLVETVFQAGQKKKKEAA